MTCVVGLKTNSGVYIGADRQLTEGSLKVGSALPKVFEIGEFLFGCSGHPREWQVIQYGWQLAHSSKSGFADIDPLKYMVLVVAKYIRQLLVENKAMPDTPGAYMESSFLIGFRGELYCIPADFQVMKVEKDYYALGSGYQYALGALSALRSYQFELPDERRVQIALTAANQFDPKTGKQFDICHQSK